MSEMASTTPNKLGQTIQFLENVGMHHDSKELLMLAAEQHSMSVRFKNLVEDASQKTFICKVEIGGLLDECIGYGQSKREAEMNAADDAIVKLTENLKVPKPSVGTPQEQPPSMRMSETDAASSMNGSPSYKSRLPRLTSLLDNGSNVMAYNNPIGELQELATARGWPTPEYNEIEECGEPHRKTFFIECKLKHNISEGQGSTKKAAKKQAAEEMLKMVQPTTSSGPSLFRNFSAPGVEQRDSPRHSVASTVRRCGRESPLSSVVPLEKMKISSTEMNRRPENFHCDKLNKEAKKKNWKVQWYDIKEKGYSGNYQCFIKINTEPAATVCSGSGPTVSFAHDNAAMNALNCLKE